MIRRGGIVQRFKIIVVEDDDECRKMLVGYIERYCSDECVSTDIITYPSADDFLAEYKNDADMVFMDICMNGTDGMTASRKMRLTDPKVMLIFVTTMAKFAVEGYEVNAFNYIVKPVDYYEFRLKIDKAFKTLTDGRDKIRIMANGEQHWFNRKDIIYVEVANHYLNFRIKDGKKLTVYGSMTQLEKTLSFNMFARCNACYMVNLSYVTGVKGFELELATGEKLQISQSKRKQFVQKLAKYFGGGV